MSTLHGIGLLLLAVIAGAVVPFQSAINANLGRGLGHPLWATLLGGGGSPTTDVPGLGRD